MLTPRPSRSSRTRSGTQLSAVRQQIDQIDVQVLRLLSRRAQLALDIGRIKHRRKWPVFDATREASVLRYVQDANVGPLSASAVRRVFQAILRECRRRERSPRRHAR